MIQWCMDRKQEIQKQIAELQRELALEVGVFSVNILTDSGWSGGMVVKSLDDSDIIEALHKNEYLIFNGEDNIVVTCKEAGYRGVFHVSKVVSYNITPF